MTLADIRRIHRAGYDHALITILEDLRLREWARSISPGGEREEAEVTDIIAAVNRRLLRTPSEPYQVGKS